MSLPKGPGSIEGLATADFAPSLATGSSSYEIAIAVPPASAGFGPRIALAYDSGGGVTEIGIGWRVIGTAKVKRRTEDGLPRFDDTDSFGLVGLGTPSELLEVTPGTYRPSVEDGSFVRLGRSEEDRDTWEARTKAGRTLLFGGAGYLEAEGDHVSASLLREERDRHGHSIRYEWDTSAGHALLTRVVWNAFDAASTNELEFLYEARPDTHRLFSSGIRQTITKRLVSVRVAHGGSLVRRYDLAYGDVGSPGASFGGARAPGRHEPDAGVALRVHGVSPGNRRALDERVDRRRQRRPDGGDAGRARALSPGSGRCHRGHGRRRTA
ncbi:MAG TPA: SpvB/TcaC N-terminal domain-containing protein, partial [Polyangiaceae bacterium]